MSIQQELLHSLQPKLELQLDVVHALLVKLYSKAVPIPNDTRADICNICQYRNISVLDFDTDV